MEKYETLFTGGLLEPTDVEKMAAKGIVVSIARPDLDESELASLLSGKDAYILGGVEHVTARVLEHADQLKVIAFLGVGYHAFIDTPAATRRGIAVTNAPGANSRAVAEFAIGLMLDAWRRITYLTDATKAGRWEEDKRQNLYGKTLGVVGLGNIGSIVARIASHGFGMRVVYSGPRSKPAAERDLGAVRLPLDELLAQSDVVTLHAPYGPETEGMLDAQRLARIKPGAVIVNTSESELIDATALRNALLSGRVRAVAMDGYYVEPTPAPEDDKLGLLALPHDRVLVTPHTANATAESFQAMLQANVDAIVNVLGTGRDQRVVNPEFRQHAQWIGQDER